jgi:hypothetical protein
MSKMLALASCAVLSLSALSASAGVVRVAEAAFQPSAGLITFSEFAVNTVNPTYNPGDYGGGGGAPVVTTGGWFAGQSLSATPGVDCPGASPSACIVGAPTGPLSLDALAPNTFITTDGSNPTSPVLSGTPRFNGGIALLFSVDQVGVGFVGGFFDAVGSTGITAFARDGTVLGTVINTITGIEFLGLVTDDAMPQIAGVFLDLVGSEPAGFAVDNIRFGLARDIIIDPDPSPIPVPAALPLLAGALGLMGLFGRRRKAA